MQVSMWKIVCAFGCGVFLASCSALVISQHSSGWISVTPAFLRLGDGDVGGWPFKFIGFDSDSPSRGITKIDQFNGILFLLNTIFWSSLCFFAAVAMQYCCQDWLLKSTWHQWIFVAMLLIPAVYELGCFGLNVLSFFSLPSISLPSLRLALANWLSADSVENALRFTMIVYSTFVGLCLTWLLVYISHMHRNVPFHYLFSAIGLLLCMHLTNHPLLYTYLQQKLDRPFTVDSLFMAPRENDTGYILNYSLVSLQLPQEHAIYEIRCAPFYSLRWLNDHWRWSTIHYVQQIGGAIYEKVAGTYLRDKQFVQQEALHGTLTIHSKTLPKYLFVAIREHAEPSVKNDGKTGYYQWYLVPLAEDMIIDGSFLGEGTDSG